MIIVNLSSSCVTFEMLCAWVFAQRFVLAARVSKGVDFCRLWLVFVKDLHSLTFGSLLCEFVLWGLCIEGHLFFTCFPPVKNLFFLFTSRYYPEQSEHYLSVIMMMMMMIIIIVISLLLLPSSSSSLLLSLWLLLLLLPSYALHSTYLGLYAQCFLRCSSSCPGKRTWAFL